MTTSAPSTSKNPFRAPHLNPQHTNQSSSSASVVPEPPAQPRQPQRTGTSFSEVIPDDAPPAYTPSADAYQGEATVDLGPSRAFQPAPPLWVTMSPQLTGVSGANGPLALQLTGASSVNGPVNVPPSSVSWQMPTPPESVASAFSPPPGRPPPPRHPSTASPAPTRTFSPPPGPPPATTPTFPPPPRHPSTSTRTFSPPPGPPPRHTHLPLSNPPQHFQPPPGPPPRSSASSAPNEHLSVGPPAIPDHARPTTTPVPGRPLLRDGRMLVYPTGHICTKCNNTGYKNFDPSHPCRKCWERYAKPYTGALLYAPTSSSPGSGGNFQRPLPNFRPPHAESVSWYSAAARSTHSPPSPPAPRPTTILAPSCALPSPSAMVVQPGDPRIGGRLCWRCGGRGSVSFMLFDQETCEVCKGLGRVFN